MQVGAGGERLEQRFRGRQGRGGFASRGSGGRGGREGQEGDVEDLEVVVVVDNVGVVEVRTLRGKDDLVGLRGEGGGGEAEGAWRPMEG